MTTRVLLGLYAVLCGCGDNSRSCGEGTNDIDGNGECLPDDDVSGGKCGNGTRLDPTTRECVPDASLCGGGTVLVNGKCQDPASGLDIDLQEGPEPNAFEPGAIPAGLVALEPVGSDGFVIKGCIKPIDDATPDLDVYLISITEPTLIKITADGVEGCAAGFQVTSTVAALATWKRFGISTSTDMSRRQVWLPAPGMYHLIMGDSRTFMPQVTGGGGLAPPAGNPDGTSCYFVTIDQQTPMPAALDLVAGDMGTIHEDLKFYSSTTLSGQVRLTNSMTTAFAQESIVVMRNNVLFFFDDDGSTSFNGINNGDAALVVSDFVYNYALFASPYRLTSP